MENPAYASGFSVADIEPAAGDSLINTLSKWNETRLIKARLSSDIDEVYALNDEDLRRAFGTPSLERREGTSRMVQYIAGECAADFYYQDSETRKIKYYEFRPLEDAAASQEDCQAALLAQL